MQWPWSDPGLCHFKRMLVFCFGWIKHKAFLRNATAMPGVCLPVRCSDGTRVSPHDSQKYILQNSSGDYLSRRDNPWVENTIVKSTFHRNVLCIFFG